MPASNKVLKIIKGLNTFSPDDLVIMTGLEEFEAKDVINKYLHSGTVIKLSDYEYKYINKIHSRKKSFELVKKPDIKLVPNNKINFKQAAEYFIVNHAMKNCTPSTLKTYVSIIRVHLIPFFNEIKIQNITQENIEEFIKLKQRQNLSNRRIRNCVTLLGNIFNKLKEWGFISDKPYIGIINVQFQKENKIKALDKHETEYLLEESKKHSPSFYLMILLALSTGLKKSEILALKKSDIDLKNKKINIDKTLYEGKILYPKVKTAIREIDIPENIITILKEVIKGKQEGDFIFYDANSSCHRQDKAIRNALSNILKELNLEGLTFNELRHTYAYNSLLQGMSIDYLHKQLGDYSIQATMDRYRDFVRI